MALARLNAVEFAPDDFGIGHLVLHTVVDVLERIVAEYEELADAEPMLAEHHRVSAARFRGAAYDGPVTAST
ncbi:hypothetical protein ACFV0C_37685 [Streptomyces sp. NPDC059568]|uniref:hypothetical protein n=1 Tax=Streptomyces sp. NPDC059568 TaxID=3346868 RepID=UPI0036D0E4BD